MDGLYDIYTIYVKIKGVKSAASKAEERVLEEQKKIEKKSTLYGYIQSQSLHVTSDPKEAAAHQITLAHMLKRKDVINQISFSETKDKTITEYTKSSIAQIARTENTLTFNEDKKVYCFTNGKWGYKTLPKLHVIKVKYSFVYYPKLPELWYRVTFDDITTGDTKDGDNADQLDSEFDSEVSQSENRVAGLMNVGISKLLGEDRKVYDVFHDVLSDAGYYTDNINEITSEDANKVEETTGKIVAVITNIGMVLSIIMPAILGIKYMLGSVEEKAEYKKGMVPYLIGALLLFSICAVVKIIQYIGDNISKI